jgi:CRP-like cAMP-binding protein
MRSCLFLLASACIAGLVHAQTPQPVTIVVPFSAGSAQDVFTRLISDRLAQELRAPVLIINKAGAGGTLGAAFVAHAKPDGKTYLLASSSHHLAGALHPRLSYHPLDSFRGAAFLGMTEFVLIVSETMKTSDLATFVARVQSQPNEFNYASAGSGSVTHAGMASFLNKAGLQMVHIPLKGTGEISGLSSVFAESTYPADLVAVGATQVLHIERARLVDLISRDPAVSVDLLRILGLRINQLFDTLADRGMHSLEQRVWAALERIAKFNSVAVPDGVMLRVSQSDLAQAASASRQRVNQQLRHFQEQGLIRLGYRNIVLLRR